MASSATRLLRLEATHRPRASGSGFTRQQIEELAALLMRFPNDNETQLPADEAAEISARISAILSAPGRCERRERIPESRIDEKRSTSLEA